MKKLFLAIGIFLYSQTYAQVDISKLVQYCDSVMNYGIEYPMIPGAILGLASSDSIYLLSGYGYGDYERKTSVEPENTLFQWGSVGKVVTSIALLQQVDAGKIALHDDVGQYLDNWQLDNPFGNAVTPFHLLTHSAGFNDRFIGYLAKNQSEVEPLGIHLKHKMPSLFKPPGVEINYSNYGYALAGHLAAKLTGLPFEDLVQQEIFDLLKMSWATYDLPDDYLDDDRYANGYSWRDTFVQSKMYPRHATPAGSVLMTGKDIIILAQAILKRDSVLLSDEGYDKLLTQQFTNHPKLTGFTLGLEVQNFNGQRAFAKSGQVTGFLSAIIIIPDLDLAIILSTNTETDNHFDNLVPGLINEFFPPKKTKVENLDFVLQDYTGNYANERSSHKTIEEMFAMFNNVFTIHADESGNLQAFHDGDWHEYQYLGEDVFQDLANPDTYIIFKRDVHGKIQSMYRNVVIGGLQIPASYRKLGWLERPRFINDEYPFALLLLPVYLLLPLIWIGQAAISGKRPSFLLNKDVRLYIHLAAFSFMALFLWNILGFFVPLIKLGEQMALGLPEFLMKMKYVNWVMAFNTVLLLLLAVFLWKEKKDPLWFRIYYSLFGLVALSYVLILHHWHLLNVTV